MIRRRMVATIIMKDDQDEENADQSGLVVGLLPESPLFCAFGLQPDHYHNYCDHNNNDHKDHNDLDDFDEDDEDQT